jgi:6-phosphogluconate dehydrogenase
MESLLFNDFFIKAVEKAEPGWRRVVAQSVLNGTPIPAFASALTFYDGYRYVVASGL